MVALAPIVILSAQPMVVLDFSIVNVALPSLQRDLGFSPRPSPSPRTGQPELVSEVPEARHVGITVELSGETVDRRLDHAAQRQPPRQSSSTERHSSKQPSKSRLSMHAFLQASKSSAHCLRHSSGT